MSFLGFHKFCGTVAVLALSPVGHALGGEDQAASFLRRAFDRHGWEACVFWENEAVSSKGQWDLVLSYGAFCPAPSQPAVFWHFNERLHLEECNLLKRLGYTHLATNQPPGFRSEKQNRAVSEHFGRALYLPLAADRSQLGMDKNQQGNCSECNIVYVGNWNRYKGHQTEVMLERFMDAGLSIYGGSQWKNHPTLSKCWAGILPPESWSTLASRARIQLALRSPQQAAFGMAPDRLFGLVATGAKRILSDGPPCMELADRITWMDGDKVPELDDIEPLNNGGSEFIESGHLFDHRVAKIIETVGHAGA